MGILRKIFNPFLKILSKMCPNLYFVWQIGYFSPFDFLFFFFFVFSLHDPPLDLWRKIKSHWKTPSLELLTQFAQTQFCIFLNDSFLSKMCPNLYFVWQIGYFSSFDFPFFFFCLSLHDPPPLGPLEKN